jgi:hypothetical protein
MAKLEAVSFFLLFDFRSENILDQLFELILFLKKTFADSHIKRVYLMNLAILFISNEHKIDRGTCVVVVLSLISF